MKQQMSATQTHAKMEVLALTVSTPSPATVLLGILEMTVV